MSNLSTGKRWVVVGTTAVVGIGGPLAVAALGGIELNDRSDDLGSAIVVRSADRLESLDAVDSSPESADSPNASPFDSAGSATDSPDDPGYLDPSPESADSPNASAADSPPPAPAPAPVPPPPPAGGARQCLVRWRRWWIGGLRRERGVSRLTQCAVA